MIELDAAKVLSIPRKIKSVEVVRRGFMSNFLFQNISNIFSAPKEVIEIIENFQPLKEPKSTIPMDEGTKDGLSINDEGEVELTDDYVIGVADDVFGDKIYDTEEIEHVIDQVMEQPGNEDEFLKKLKESFKEKAVDVIVGKAKDNYGDDMRTSDKKFLERSLKAKSDRMVDRIATDYEFEKQEIETERQNALKNLENWGKESAAVNEEFDKKQKEAAEKLKEAEKEIADGEKEIADNEKKLSDAKAQLDNAGSTLASGKAQLDSGWVQLEAGRKELEKNEKALTDGEKELKTAQKQIDEGLAQIKTAEKQLDGQQKELEEQQNGSE